MPEPKEPIEKMESYLKAVPLFASLSPPELEAVAEHMRQCHWDTGEIIFRQGDAGDAMYIIKDGRVKIFSTEGESEITYTIYESGDYFGEFSLIDGEARSASAATLTKTEAMVLDSSNLLRLLTEHPEISLSIMKGIVKRIRHTTEYAEELAFLDVYGRVTVRLLDLAERYGHRDEEGKIEIEVPVNLTQLASLASTNVDIVRRILDFYATGKLIRIDKERVTILKEDILRQRLASHRKRKLV